MGIDATVGFLGFGNMGYAILRGLIAQGALRPERACVYDVNALRREQAAELGVRFAESPEDLWTSAEVVLLAVKPQNMAAALEPLVKGGDTDHLVVSIAAGITTTYLHGLLGPEARIARVMPNTPALVGAGAAGIALGTHCTERDGAIAAAIFEAVGVAVTVDESQIDMVTALSGSGPAYFFYFVECLVKAAKAQGLPEAVATQLAAQTLLGAGKLLAESGEPARDLREKVTSKGGTTAAALLVFEDGGLADLVAEAVAAARTRAQQLAQ